MVHIYYRLQVIGETQKYLFTNLKVDRIGGQVTSGLKENTDTLEKATVMFHTSLFIETFPPAELQASCNRMINLHLNGIVTDKGSRHAGN